MPVTSGLGMCTWKKCKNLTASEENSLVELSCTEVPFTSSDFWLQAKKRRYAALESKALS
jgi:hypothetical protein